MADGQSKSYSANAQRAAAGAASCSPGGCPACVKTGLPVLLVRPGLGAQKFLFGKPDEIAPLKRGVADPPLTAARYVMRALRKGYLYAYYEKAHTPELKAQGGWQAFRVDDGGYLTPISLAEAASDRDESFVCTRAESYATAMLFVIPDAHNTGRVWAGYTSHPWSEQVRQNYAKDEALRNKRMACINASKGTCERAINLTVESLQRNVVDFVPRLDPDILAGNPFPGRFAEIPILTQEEAAQEMRIKGMLADPERKPRKETAAEVWEQACRMIAKDPQKTFSESNLMIVSVPDIEGVITEAAQRRITLCNTATEWLARQNTSYGLQSALQIEGMLKLIEQNGEQLKAQNRGLASRNGEKITKKDFDQQVKDNVLPPDTIFLPTSLGPSKVNPDEMLVDMENGTLLIRSDKFADGKTASLKEEVLGKLQREGGKAKYKKFLEDYYKRRDDDAKLLAKVEQDYGAWINSKERKFLTTHDFSCSSSMDGFFYARCISNILVGGPITAKGLEWQKGFLKEDPTDKDALLTRALLGNQDSFFEWFAKLDQQGKLYDTAKGVLDLSHVKAAIHNTAGAVQSATVAKASALAAKAAQYTSELLSVADALIQMNLDATERMRYQLKLLTMDLITKSEAAPVTILKLNLALPEATRLWNIMLGDLRDKLTQAGQVGTRKVESLLLNTAAAVELNGAPKTAMAMLDVYLVVRGDPASTAKVAGQISSATKRYLLQPAEIYAGRATALAARYVDFAELSGIARNSMTTMRSGGALLSTGSGILQGLLLRKAWKDYAGANSEDRVSAAISMLTAGLGVSGALLEIRAAYLATLSKTVAETGVRRIAGSLLAGATAIDGLQAFINAGKASQDGDASATKLYLLQGLLFFGAVYASAAALGLGGATSAGMLGLSATGWGLILVGLGALVGFVVLLVKDKPVEKWAAKTYWGNASDKWGDLDKEIREANKVALGAQIDFSYRYNALENAGKIANATGMGMGMIGPAIKGAEAVAKKAYDAIFGDNKAPTKAEEALITREAWLRLKMPKQLRRKLPWKMEVVGVSTAGERILGRAVHMIDGVTSNSTALSDGVYKVEASEPEGDDSMVLSVKLDPNRFRTIRALVRVYAAAAAGVLVSDAVGAGDQTVIIIDEQLTD